MSQGGSSGTQSIQALERGLAVIQAFSREHAALTLSDVARLTGTSRATARRILLTLEGLGHVRSDGRRFSLTPRVLELGWAYMCSLDLTDLAVPLMKELVSTTGESSSIATLDLPDIVYVARVPTQRIMSLTLNVGTRLPAAATSMGRVMLADLPEQELDAFLASGSLQAYTERTTAEVEGLRRVLADVDRQGYALVDQELEVGLRSIAAPLRAADGRVLAALNVSAAASRVSIDDLRTRILPVLMTTAEAISTALSRTGVDTSTRSV